MSRGRDPIARAKAIAEQEAEIKMLEKYMQTAQFQTAWRNLPQRERTRLTLNPRAKLSYTKILRLAKSPDIPVKQFMKTKEFRIAWAKYIEGRGKKMSKGRFAEFLLKKRAIPLSVAKIETVAASLGVAPEKVEETIEKVASDKGVAVEDVKVSEVKTEIKNGKLFGLPRNTAYIIAALLAGGIALLIIRR